MNKPEQFLTTARPDSRADFRAGVCVRLLQELLRLRLYVAQGSLAQETYSRQIIGLKRSPLTSPNVVVVHKSLRSVCSGGRVTAAQRPRGPGRCWSKSLDGPGVFLERPGVPLS